MATPTILFDSGTGSDTAASGAGPATAKTGTAAATHANTTVNITDGGVDLSSVATDGSAALWVLSSSGRQFSGITNITGSVGNWTVTVANAYANTESGKTWAIGGKRATFDNTNSRTVFSDAVDNWIIQTATTQNITGSAITLSATGSATGYITVQGDSVSTQRLLSQSANAAIFSVTNTAFLIFKNLQWQNTNVTKTSADGLIHTGQVQLYFQNCNFGDATNQLHCGVNRSSSPSYWIFVDCAIHDCTSVGINSAASTGALYLYGCDVLSNAGGGISFSGATGTGSFDFSLINCLICKNTGVGASYAGTGGVIVTRCTIDANTSDNVQLSGAFCQLVADSTNFTTGGGYGLNATSAPGTIPIFLNYNNYGTGGTANTSGALHNLTSGASDLNVNPGYTATASNNYGVGSNVRAKGFPDATRNIGANQSATVNNSDIGAAQHQDAGGGAAGMLYIPNLEGI